MTALNQDFTMFQGETKRINVTAKVGGSRIDLTDCELTWKLSSGPIETAILSKTVGDGITITEAEDGELEIVLDSEDTTSLHGDYYHQLVVTDEAEEETVLLVGNIAISPRL